jgi:hypothetical protein
MARVALGFPGSMNDPGSRRIPCQSPGCDGLFTTAGLFSPCAAIGASRPFSPWKSCQPLCYGGVVMPDRENDEARMTNDEGRATDEREAQTMEGTALLSKTYGNWMQQHFDEQVAAGDATCTAVRQARRLASGMVAARFTRPTA